MRMLSPLSVVPMSSVFDEMDRFMESFATPALRTGTALGETGRGFSFGAETEVQEGEDHYLVSFDMPGVKRDSIKVETKGQQLWIASERQRLTKGTQKFERTFTLPNSIDKEKIEVHYEDGVLSLYLPQAEAAKPRTIEVQSGKPEGFFSKLLGGQKTSDSKLEVKSDH